MCLIGLKHVGPDLLRRLSLIAASTLLLACGTLPDAGKLADASVELRSAIAASGAATQTELRLAELKDEDAQFQEAWAVVDRSTAALVSYANSLSDIVRAGQEGGESARRLANAGTELASTAGLALPAAGVTAFVDLAAYVYQQIAIVRASESLEASLTHMQPAVDKIAGLIGAQLDSTIQILTSASQFSQNELRREYSDETGYLLALQRERRALYARGPTTTNVAEQITRIDSVERVLMARLVPLHKQLDESRIRLRSSTQLVAAAKLAVNDWANAHRQLGVTVREKRALDPKALLASIAELRVLVRNLRETS